MIRITKPEKLYSNFHKISSVLIHGIGKRAIRVVVSPHSKENNYFPCQDNVAVAAALVANQRGWKTVVVETTAFGHYVDCFNIPMFAEFCSYRRKKGIRFDSNPKNIPTSILPPPASNKMWMDDREFFLQSNPSKRPEYLLAEKPMFNRPKTLSAVSDGLEPQSVWGYGR